MKSLYFLFIALVLQGLLFLVSMNQGSLRRIMKIWKMIHLFSPLLFPLDIQLLEKDTELSNEKNIQDN